MEIAYVLTYLLCNLFQVYIAYYLYKTFFQERVSPRKLEVLSFLLFFVVSSLLNLLYRLPVLNLFVGICGFFLLTFNYRASIWRRIITTSLLYIFMACVETCAAGIFYTMPVDSTSYNANQSIFVPIASTILMYVVSLFLVKLKNVQRDVKIPVLYWVMLISIPLAALYFLLLTMESGGLSLTKISICSALILGIVFSTFYLYDSVIAQMSSRLENELLARENKFYSYHLEQMRTSLEANRKLQHDIKNHFIAIEAYAQRGQTTELVEYITKINKSLQTSKSQIDTGNTVIDSVLNFKIQEALQKGVTINTKLNIPDTLDIAPFDVVIILGNLLDNAIRATAQVEQEHNIQLSIVYSKGRVILHMENPYTGEIKRKGKRILTSKQDNDLHGLGLANVEDTVLKYNGALDITSENQQFKVTVVLYV